MSVQGTYGEEVLCSSPMGSIIDVSTDHVTRDEIKSDNEGESSDGDEIPLGENTLANTVLKESDLNVYSYNAIATQDLVLKEDNSLSTPKKNLTPNVISLSSERYNTSPKPHSLEEQEDEEDSGLMEISQLEYTNSQKMKFETLSSPQLIPEEWKSAQTPITSSPQANNHGYFQSSSPSISQNQMETQPTSSQRIPEVTNGELSMAPSAQLTSFRIQSPKKIVSEMPTPTKRKNLLITQESFNIPNLISPTNTSPLKPELHAQTQTQTQTQTQEQFSQESFYLTARQSDMGSSLKGRTKETLETRTTKVRFKGVVHTKSSSPGAPYQTKVIRPTKRPLESSQDTNINTQDQQEIPDSSEDEDISIIEITRTIKKPKKSVLQVPSSPGISPYKIKSTQEEKDEGEEVLSTQSVLNTEIDELPTEELKRKIIQYGLKPARSRIKMIQSIKEVTAFLKEDSLTKLSQSQNITHSQNIVKTDVFQAINESMLENPQLMEKIYTFEPIKTKEIVSYLQQRGITVAPDMFKEWCDNNSICLIEEQEPKK